MSVKVKRIVADLTADDSDQMKAFYAELFDLSIAMDLGWVATLGGSERAPVQLSILSQAGSGAPMPSLTIEVDDLDSVAKRVAARGLAFEYPITTEPWGVRRFMVQDPSGKYVNVMEHL